MSAAIDASPLLGLRVVVTRARKQAAPLADSLRQLGATVIELPVIEIDPAPPAPIDEAIARLGSYDWLIFTSVNGVAAFAERFELTAADPSLIDNVEIAAIGRATAERVRECGWTVSFIPERFVAESVVEGLVARGMRGKRVLLPRADIARDTLPEGLRSAGAVVDIVVAYRTRRPDGVDQALLRSVRDGAADLLTFASPSTARNLADLLGDGLPPTPAICIGPVTERAARECGFKVVATAGEYSIAGMVRAVIDYRRALDDAGERQR